jgi:hypothetical protein
MQFMSSEISLNPNSQPIDFLSAVIFTRLFLWRACPPALWRVWFLTVYSLLARRSLQAKTAQSKNLNFSGQPFSTLRKFFYIDKMSMTAIFCV